MAQKCGWSDLTERYRVSGALQSSTTIGGRGMYLDFEPGTQVQLLDANRTGTVLEVEDDHYIVGLHSDQYEGIANRAELVDAWPHEVVLLDPSPAQIQAGADAITGSMLPASTAQALAEAVLRAARRAWGN